ncbi:hypothetical protein FACS18949_14110 [Clostridia bacterium]|nr:hypothetical protein FACS18949_14110 [Clostridia bacterium]
MNLIVFQNIYNQYRHSVMQGLSKAIGEFCDPEFVWTNYLGQRATRDELIDMLNKGLIQYEKWTSDDQKVRVFEEHTAILTATDYVVVLRVGEPHPTKVNMTVVFVKRDNGWKMVNSHASAINQTVV